MLFAITITAREGTQPPAREELQKLGDVKFVIQVGHARCVYIVASDEAPPQLRHAVGELLGGDDSEVGDWDVMPEPHQGVIR